MRLDTCRNTGDLVESYKIMNNIYNVNANILFEFYQDARRGHSRNLFKRRSRLDARKYVLSNRIVDKWNSLGDHCINTNTVNSFKSRISKPYGTGNWKILITFFYL